MRVCEGSLTSEARREKIDERPRGMFYRGPTVGAKYSYQNPVVRHVKVDVAKVGSWTSHVGFESGLC